MGKHRQASWVEGRVLPNVWKDMILLGSPTLLPWLESEVGRNGGGIAEVFSLEPPAEQPIATADSKTKPAVRSMLHRQGLWLEMVPGGQVIRVEKDRPTKEQYAGCCTAPGSMGEGKPFRSYHHVQNSSLAWKVTDMLASHPQLSKTWGYWLFVCFKPSKILL